MNVVGFCLLLLKGSHPARTAATHRTHAWPARHPAEMALLARDARSCGRAGMHLGQSTSSR